MHLLRALLTRHRAFVVVLMAAALCLKAVVPAGYMVAEDAKVLTVHICDAAAGHSATMQVSVPIEQGGGKGGGDPRPADCAYSSLSMGSVVAAGPELLLLAIAFIMVLGFAPARTHAAERISHIRPPLRGPPALA